MRRRDEGFEALLGAIVSQQVSVASARAIWARLEAAGMCDPARLAHAFTARDMQAIEAKNDNPDITIEVIGKQWSWDFNYVNANVYEAGIQSQFEGELGSEAALPTLYLPVGKTVQIDLTSRDVIHSFWVIDFLYKKDMFPERTNHMYFTPEKVGTYKGKCAELCGEYHSMMLFNVKVVPQAEYDAHMAQLAAAGNVGQLDSKFSRNQNLPQDNPEIRG